jgi:DNA-binding SARP family transcriptional activator
VFYTNECNLNSCPHTDIIFESEAENCILDKSAETSIVAENFSNQLILASLPTCEINVDTCS